MKKPIFIIKLLFIARLALASSTTFASTADLFSPDGRIRISVGTQKSLNLSVRFNQKIILTKSKISMLISHKGTNYELGDMGECEAEAIFQKRQKIKPVVANKRALIIDNYNELRLHCLPYFTLQLRAYDDGIAYRFVTNFQGDIYVKKETVNFEFNSNHLTYFPTEDSFISHSERFYEKIFLKDLNKDHMASLPLVIDIEGVKAAIMEADLFDYPGMYLTGTRPALTLVGKFPYYPKEEVFVKDRTLNVIKRQPYLAKTSGNRSFPWRVMLLSSKDTDLVNSDMIFKLARKNSNYPEGYWSWLKPGQVMWDWWHNFLIPDAPFKSGLNTETYKHYIDFAKKNGLKYVTFDEGWSKASNLFSINKNMDMEFLTDYATKQGVGIILWSLWNTLEKQEHEAFQKFKEWGIKGIKIDFMQRDDQKMVNYYWKMAKRAADEKLIINFHGSYKPSGIRRSFPNVLTREGVTGLEQLKANHRPDPKDNVTLPYIRMLSGPMDYTPGAMTTYGFNQRHLHPTDQKRRRLPSGLGTRSHQLAMYVIYESPLQMLADSPSKYRKETTSLNFITQIPTVWDETVMLGGKLGDYIALARSSGNSWFIGVMTDWNERQIVINMNFLEDGCYKLEAISDTENSINDGTDYEHEISQMKSGEQISISLAPGGGWVAKLDKIGC